MEVLGLPGAILTLSSLDFFGLVGAILVLLGWIWAMVNGFQTGGAVWGVLNIIPYQPLIGVISAAMKNVSCTPVLVMLAGLIISMLG